MITDWPARFEEFVAERTREAAAAALPRYTTVSVATHPGAIAIGNGWTEHLFDGPFYITPPPPGRPSCSLVFVQSADGNTGARNPGSLGGGDTDKHLIYEGLSRVAADGVLAGAETIRGGQLILSVWHPELVALRASLGKPRHPTQIVATLRGIDLDAGLLFNLPAVPVVLVTVGAVAERMEPAIRARPWIRVVAMGHAGDLPSAFAALRDAGLATVSCIGGRTLAGALLDARLVDDLYLTTAAKPGGEPGTPLHAQPIDGHLALRKHGTGVETGVRFDHLHAPAVRGRV